MIVDITLYPAEISLKNLLSISDIENLRIFFENYKKINAKELFDGLEHVLGNRCPSKESVEFLFKELGCCCCIFLFACRY
jgi:hypothetical protein